MDMDRTGDCGHPDVCLSLPFFPNDLQAWGNNLAATAVLVGGLVWHILHPPGKAAAGIEDSPDDELALVHPTSISRLS